MITQGAAASGRFRNAAQAASDAWTKTSLLSISRVQRLRTARDLVEAGDPVALAKMLVDMAGPIRQVNLSDALSARMAQHQKLMELICRAAFRSEVLEASARGRQLDVAGVQRRLEAWIEFGRWSPVAGVQPESLDVGAARSGDMAQVCCAGCKPAEAVLLRLTLVAPLAPALEHLRLAVDVPDAVLDSMAATQEKAREGSAALDAEDDAQDKAEQPAERAAAAADGAPDRAADTAPRAKG